jgi:hypothetical protein
MKTIHISTKGREIDPNHLPVMALDFSRLHARRPVAVSVAGSKVIRVLRAYSAAGRAL